MRTEIRRWLSRRRYRTMLRQLEKLPPEEAQRLGIKRSEYQYLARRVAKL